MSLLQNREKENRPWGSYERFTLNEATSVKIVRVKPGERFSEQYHQHRDEFWHVIEGSGVAHIGDQEFPATPGSEFEIPEKTKHRMTGGENGIAFLEIALGDFDEGDIVRLQDDYGRS